MTTPGIYVIEISDSTIKVGRSKNLDSRVATHLRNARSVGMNPTRYRTYETPDMESDELRCLRAVKGAGGVQTEGSREVFTGLSFEAVVTEVERALGMKCSHLLQSNNTCLRCGKSMETV